VEGSIPTGSFNGTYYRMVNQASKDPRLSGPYGRFHNVGDGDTTYTGETPWTCEKEIRANLKGEFVPAAWQIMSVEFALERVVDLRKGSVRRRLGMKKEWILDPKRLERAQQLGRRLRRQGAQGIIYESVRDPGRTNVVVFLENVVEGVHIRFGDRKRLTNS
jgi:hypothetical protein